MVGRCGGQGAGDGGGRNPGVERERVSLDEEDAAACPPEPRIAPAGAALADSADGPGRRTDVREWHGRILER